MLNAASRIFPIIGDPIKYARTPVVLTETFEKHGHNGACIPLQVLDGGLDIAMPALSAMPNIDGILVTMPHKFAAFPYCSTVSQTSKLLGVVSHLRRNPDGSWHGDNLDGKSFVKAQIDHGAQPEGARALLLGAGGAGSATAIALLEAGVSDLIIHDLDPARVTRLIETLGDLGKGRVRAGSNDPTGCAMVCNATPMGMDDNDPLPIDPAKLDSSMFVGDVISGHGETQIMQVAREAGCKTSNGDQMVEAVLDMMIEYFLGR